MTPISCLYFGSYYFCVVISHTGFCACLPFTAPLPWSFQHSLAEFATLGQIPTPSSCSQWASWIGGGIFQYMPGHSQEYYHIDAI